MTASVQQTADDMTRDILFLAAVHLLLLAVVGSLVTWQAIRLWRGKVKNSGQKIVAIGLAALVLPDVFYNALVLPVYTLVNNLQYLFYAYHCYLLKSDRPEASNADMPLNAKTISFSQVIHSFPLAGLFEALALITVIYYVMGKGLSGRLRLPQIPASLAGKTKSHILILNTGICFCLLFSIYFVISVCVTIPYLNEMKKATGFTQHTVDSTLGVMSKNDTIQPRAVPAAPFNGLVTIDTLEKDTGTKKQFLALNPYKKNIVITAINNLQTESGFTLGMRAEQARKINDFYSNYKSNNSRIKDDLSRTFETNSNNIAIDKNMLYKELMDAFDDYLSHNSQNYQQAFIDLGKQDANNSEAFSQAKANIKNMISLMAKDTASLAGYYFNESNSPGGTYQPYSVNLGNNTVSSVNTAYERNGSDWGPLGWSAGYLIKTKSLDLVLLVGMIGFGILGASILSFVPMNDFFKAFGQHAMIKNFPNVLARGFGAALIIYLATKGGLAIFTLGNSQDPNGYILLLTCFVGAVFSEKVWNKISTYVGGAAAPQQPVVAKPGG